METIEIFESEKNTIWNDGKTFLLVFDKNNNQVADYDFSTGLKILEKNNKNIIFMHDEDLVPGSWKFYGSKVKVIEEKIIETKVTSEGFKDGKSIKRKYKNEDPWNTTRVGGQYVLAKEREKRISICRSCPFFNKEEGLCKVNGMISIEMTKHEISYCPESKWGNKEKSSEALISQIGINEEIQKNQEKFDKDLEEYLKEL